MLPRFIFITSVIAAPALAQNPVVAPESKGPAALPKDVAILDIEIPRGAAATLDGKDVGAERQFKFTGLKEDRFDKHEIVVKPEKGEAIRHSILLRGGWRVRLPWMLPEAERPGLVIQAEHTQDVRWVAYSPDGKFLLTASSDKTAVLWDAATGRKLRTFDDHKEGLEYAAFADDGRSVLTATGAEMAVLWDTKTGKKLREFKAPVDKEQEFKYCRTVLSADGKTIMLAGRNPFEIREAATDKLIVRVEYSRGPGFRNEITSMALSPDGKRALTGHDRGQLVIWDAVAGKPLHDFKGPHHLGKYVSSAFSPDGKYAAAGYQSIGDRNPTHVVVFDVGLGKQIHEFKLKWRSSTLPIAFSADGRMLFASDGEQNRVIGWELPSGEYVRVLPTYCGNCMAFRGNGTVIAVAAQNHVDLCDGLSGKQLLRFGVPARSVKRVAIRPDGQELLTATNKVSAWGQNNGRRFASLRHPEEWEVDALQYPREGGAAMVAACHEYAALWEPSNGRIIAKMERPFLSMLHCAKINANGSRAIVGFQRDFHDAAVVYEPHSGKILHRIQTPAKGCLSVAMAPDGTRFAIIFEAKDFRERNLLIIYDANAKEIGRPHTMHQPIEIEFTPDGNGLLVHDRWKATLFDANGKNAGRTFTPGDPIFRMAFSPDGRYVGFAGRNKSPTLWDVQTGAQIRMFVGHTDWVEDLAISSDNRLVLTGSRDGTARIWDMATGQELGALLMLDDNKEWLVVTPDGLFDGSARARECVAFRLDDKLNVVPVDRFFQDFNRPGLLRELWSGARPTAEVKVGAKLPPTIKILSPNADGEVSTAEVEIEAEVTDAGGGISGPWITNNGIAFKRSASALTRDGKVARRKFKLDLLPGTNRIEVRAACGDGSQESEQAVITLQYKKPLNKPDLYVLTVGVNKYAHETLNLKFAAPDAEAMAKLFVLRGSILYAEVHNKVLTDALATKANIENALDELGKKARPQDTLVVYLAGHGAMVGDIYYFVPHEFRREENTEASVKKYGIAGDVLAERLAGLKPLRRVLILDTCNAGGALGVKRGGRSLDGFRGSVEKLSRANGVFTLGAAASGEEAKEEPELGHGVLTYTLLAALKAVDGGPLEDRPLPANSAEGVAEVVEWFDYASAHVPRLTKRYFGREQDVQFSALGGNFPLLPLRAK